MAQQILLDALAQLHILDQVLAAVDVGDNFAAHALRVERRQLADQVPELLDGPIRAGRRVHIIDGDGDWLYEIRSVAQCGEPALGPW